VRGETSTRRRRLNVGLALAAAAALHASASAATAGSMANGGGMANAGSLANAGTGATGAKGAIGADPAIVANAANGADVANGAKGAPGSLTTLTLDQAIELALRGNPGLRAQGATIEATRAGEITAALRPNPTFTNGTVDFTGGIGWTFERGGKRQRRIDSARLATAASRSDYQDARRTLIVQVRTTFTAALLAHGNLLAAQENLDNFQRVEDLNRVRFDKGDISGGDFLKISLQKLQFQTDREDADLAFRTARANLRQSINAAELAAEFDVVGELRPAAPALTLQNLEARAIATRPDLAAAATAARKAQADVDLARANAKVDVTVSVGWIHSGPSLAADDHVQPLFSLGQSANAIGTGISVPLPIFDRNQGEIARTRAEVLRAQAAADAVRAQVINDVETAWVALAASRERVELYENSYLKASRDSRDIAEFAYRKGATSILDLLDAERTDRSTRLAYRQAQADYVTHLEQLDAAVGEDLAP
jgi:cobalt-zinc-cadmium efflux system outer membrane protein